MAEIAVIIFFQVLLAAALYRNQKNVIKKAVKPLIGQLALLMVMGALLYLLWPTTAIEQIKLCLLVSFMILFLFRKEGLADNKVVKFGFLNSAYNQFSDATVESFKGKTFVTFNKSRQKNTLSLLVDCPEKDAIAFLEKRVSVNSQQQQKLG